MNEAHSSQAKEGQPRARRQLLTCFILTAAAILPFWPSTSGGWVYDDLLLIAQDSRLQSWRGLLELWSSDLFSAPQFVLQLGDHRPFYRPLVASSYALDWWWGGGRPEAFRATNLLLHAAATWLGHRMLLRWGASRPVALLASLLFALHPTRAESVAWISGRTDVMSAVFLLAGTEFYARARRLSALRSRAWPWWCAATLSLLGALLSKETAVLFPLFTLVEEWRRDGRSLREFFSKRRTWWLPWLATVSLAALYFLGRVLFLPLHPSSSGVSLLSLHHLQLIAETAGRHAGFLLLPEDLTLHSARLAVDEEGRPLLSPLFIALGAGALLVYFASLVSSWRRPRLFWLLLLSGALLLPTANVAPTGLSFSAQARYTYLALLPLAGACLMALEARFPRFLMASPLLLLFALPTWSRSADFRSNENFWRAEFRANPGVPETIRYRLGRDLSTVGRETHLRRAICGYQLARERYAGVGADDFVKQALGTLSDDPSLSAERQERLLRFLEALSDGRPAALDDRLKLTLPPESSIARSLRRSAPQLHLMAAQLHLRRGEVGQALGRARTMLSICPHCEDLRLEAAMIPLVAGRRELVREWAAALPPVQREKLEQAFSLLHGSSHRSPALQAWSAAEAGRILGLPGFSYQAMYPHLGAIAAQAPDNIRMAVALMARNVGDLATAQALFGTLPQAERLRLTREEVWTAPVFDRDEPFVEGTCALPSELEEG